VGDAIVADGNAHILVLVYDVVTTTGPVVVGQTHTHHLNPIRNPCVLQARAHHAVGETVKQ
jgi:hypothetical protein